MLDHSTCEYEYEPLKISLIIVMVVCSRVEGFLLGANVLTYVLLHVAVGGKAILNKHRTSCLYIIKSYVK